MTGYCYDFKIRTLKVHYVTFSTRPQKNQP